jgi:diaminopimelate epimerase
MMTRFHKMHGLGNDFVVVDARETPIAMSHSRASAIADRRTGIGCDQLIVLSPGVDGSDATMRIWNPDGSEVGACGNAARAVGVLIGKAVLTTLGGTIAVAPDDLGATVDMGPPHFEWQQIPLAYAMDTRAMPVGWDGLGAPVAVNVGNPHVVFFVDDVASVDLETIGPVIETDPLFPERINANVAHVVDRHRIDLRTWERGAGLTRACGTGACAAAVAAILTKRADTPVEVTMRGGTLTIDWQDTIRMTGPATLVFTGETDLEAFGA